MWTHFSKWLGLVQLSVLPAHSPLVLKHLTGFEALLGLVAFTPCFVKDEWGTNDVTDVQLFICARLPRV